VIRNADDVTNKAPHILLHKGSRLKITKDPTEGHGGEHPVISLTMPRILDHVKCNERVWFDDGLLGGIICEKNDKYLEAEITIAPETGFKLKAEKGVNFPDSNIEVPAITAEDLTHLRFIAKNADMVGFSFVQTAEDIFALQKNLKKMKREDMGIILKIETQLSFKNLPSLLFAAMRSERCGIMVARGDLAVEIGYSRMAEVQEEILWLAEAAHMPVIWATQVLETQVKKGVATRAEISDVVKAVRAECVMLNKGPHILEAIATVKDIDKRMAAHEDKKRKILRSLQVAKAFLE
jgi:pyruvate kinase